MMIWLLAILWLLGAFGPDATPAFRRTRSPMHAPRLTAVPTSHRASRQGGGGLRCAKFEAVNRFDTGD